MAQVKFKFGPIIIFVAIVATVFGGRYAYTHGLLGPSSAGSAVVPVDAPLPQLAEEQPTEAPAAGQLPLPSSTRAAMSGPEIRIQEMAWNAQTSLNYANGGIYTTQGSLMQKHGVNLHLIWEDDVGKQGSALINFATALKKGDPNPSEGAHFMAIMGDGTAATLGGIMKDLREQGADPEVIGSFGYSRGEDQLMGPATWKQNPRLAQGGLNPDGTGGLISGYLRDGDWNIALKWASDNKLYNNPDEKTWDPNAINWYSAEDYIKAADAYINGVCEERPVVKAGKRTGDTKKVCVNAVVTWTPGDVNVADQRGGLSTIVSTKQYAAQMPMTLIGIKQWDQAHADLLVELLAAGFEASDQVKTYPQALQRGCEANSIIWSAPDGAGRKPGSYWCTYYKGVAKKDKAGVAVNLGGSTVNNLNDNLLLFGLLAGGGDSVFASDYNTFARIVKQQYPKLVPDMLPVEKVVNTTYLQAVQKKYGAQLVAAADTTKIAPGAEIKQELGNRPWEINFQTGSARFTPDSMTQLSDLKNGLEVARDLGIEIHGHTDNTGDASTNKALSQARANAVKMWLIQQNSTVFYPDRFIKVVGHGSELPVATNETETGKAKNRRVEVRIGSTN